MSQEASSSSKPMQKPGMVIALAVMTLVSGIVNLFWSIAVAIFLSATFFGIICVPLAAYPLILGVIEIIYAARLFGSPTHTLRPARYLAIMEICNIIFVNFLSLVIGILALVFYNDVAVKAYFNDVEASV